MSGVDELIAALDAHREGLDLAATRVRTRRLGALADFIAEHGARGLRDLGGRREAERFLAEQPAEADEPALVAALEARAPRPARSPPARAAAARNTPRSVALPVLWPPLVVVSTATETRSLAAGQQRDLVVDEPVAAPPAALEVRRPARAG